MKGMRFQFDKGRAMKPVKVSWWLAATTVRPWLPRRCRDALTTRVRVAVSWVDLATWISGSTSPEARYCRYGLGKTAT